MGPECAPSVFVSEVQLSSFDPNDYCWHIRYPVVPAAIPNFPML
jgi:hypothetical protein